MGTPYIGEIRLVSFNFAPKGWASCNGQLLPINQNQALFALFGTTYGGNGQTNFALPNLQARAPMHRGNGHVQGEMAGSVAVTITQGQMPAHTHRMSASPSDPDTVTPGSTAPIGGIPNGFRQPESLVALTSQSVDTRGGSQPHENRQPFLGLFMVVALQGAFPSQN